MHENVIERKAVTLTLRDGKEYKLMPLTLNKLIKVWPIIAKLENLREEKVSLDVLKDMRNLIFQVLKEAAPDLTEDNAGDLVDMMDINKITQIVMGQHQIGLAALKAAAEKK